MNIRMRPIKLGFMGCGGHSSRHADVIQKMPTDYEIVGALDVNKDTAGQFLSKHNSEALSTDNVTEFLAIKEMDAVIIATPHKYHLGLCKSAICAGKHILCEKPLWEGQQREDCRRIISEASDRGLIFSSCHPRRYEKEYTYIRVYLGEYLAKFGKALELRFQFFYHEPSTGWKMDDSLLLDHMNHEIDLVHFLFGYSPAQFWRLSHSFDEYRVAGKTESGLGIWFSGYRRLNSRTFRNELEITFERGRVRTESVLDSATGMVSSTISTLSFENDRKNITQFRPHAYDNSLIGVMKNFAMAIRRGEVLCYLTPEDLLMNTAICNDLVLDEHGVI